MHVTDQIKPDIMGPKKGAFGPIQTSISAVGFKPNLLRKTNPGNHKLPSQNFPRIN